MTRLVYLEPFGAGHCVFWAQTLLRHALEDKRISQIIAVTAPDLQARMAGPPGSDKRLSLCTLDPDRLRRCTEGSLARQGWNQWLTARALLREHEADICFLPFFDHALIGACLDWRLGGRRITGVIFRPPNPYRLRGGLRHRISALRRWGMYLGSWRPGAPSLLTLDETVNEGFLGRLTGRLRFLPDPGPDMGLLDSVTPLPPDEGRRTFLLFGSLSERKGVPALLEALPHVPQQAREQIRIHLIGRIRPPDAARIEAALQAARKAAPEVRIVLENRFVSDAELAAAVKGADVVLAPYQGHVGSSGVLLWAAAAGKPVVSQEAGLMGLLIARYGLGAAVDTSNPVTLARALTAPPAYNPDGLVRFVADHSPEVFSRTVLDTLCAR